MRAEVTSARRIVVKVGSSSLTTAAGGIDPTRVSALVDALAAARARGTEVVLVSSGAIAAGLAPLGLKRRPARPRGPAGGRIGGPGPARAPLHRRPRPTRAGRRTGAADPRRRHPPLALPQRLPDVREAARARRAAHRQRERHGGHHRDPVRRQRPARGAGRPPGPRRPAAPALRRRRPVRRPAGRAGQHAAVRRGLAGRPRRRTDRPDRRRRGRDRRHADQGRGGPDRDRRRDPGGAHLRRARRRGARR